MCHSVQPPPSDGCTRGHVLPLALVNVGKLIINFTTPLSLINSCQVMVSHGVTNRPDMTRRARMIQLQSAFKLVSLLDNYNPSCTMSFEESSRWYLWQYGMLLPGCCLNNVIHYGWAVLININVVSCAGEC